MQTKRLGGFLVPHKEIMGSEKVIISPTLNYHDL